jgi:hypothetical protein
MLHYDLVDTARCLTHTVVQLVKSFVHPPSPERRARVRAAHDHAAALHRQLTEAQAHLSDVATSTRAAVGVPHSDPVDYITYVEYCNQVRAVATTVIDPEALMIAVSLCESGWAESFAALCDTATALAVRA